MADVINESVALELVKLIARSEGRRFAPGRSARSSADRQWILRTYAQCLQTIRRPASVDKWLAARPAGQGGRRR
ncbi:MAG: hypothetical protein AB7F22_16355 [Reyranella sp.]|uniref:hypothetical protein n=1 Tax=Reyranella sp. TaxID=1929291 RepID=UPI003D11F0C3